MKASFRLEWIVVLFLLNAAAFSDVPPNLIINGTFADDSGWNDLGLYDGGQGTGKVENESYIISISAAGNVPWSIQFTQNHISLDSGRVYIFSYDITSTINRTVEVSLSRNGGDYSSYSGRDTVQVSSKLFHGEKKFVMKSPTDRDVRLEFNCGKATGTITLQNLKLVLFTEPQLTVRTPQAGELLVEGAPYRITWSSLNIGGNVRIDLSGDNGATWKTIGTTPADSGAFSWVPGAPYSPWCRIRVLSVNDTAVVALNQGSFEVAPGRELVSNSRFSLAAKAWNLGVYGGTATGGMHQDSAYLIKIEKNGDDFWQIQLIQNGIRLVKGQRYIFSLTAWATAATDIKINIGMDREPYTSYFDTTKWIVALSTAPKLFTVAFTMKETSDSSARVEFNCGKSTGDIYIDEISIVPDYVAPVIPVNPERRHDGFAVCRTSLIVGAAGRGGTFYGSHVGGGRIRLFDLRGRTAGRVNLNEGERAAVGVPGVYLINRSRRYDR